MRYQFSVKKSCKVSIVYSQKKLCFSKIINLKQICVWGCAKSSFTEKTVTPLSISYHPKWSYRKNGFFSDCRLYFSGGIFWTDQESHSELGYLEQKSLCCNVAGFSLVSVRSGVQDGSLLNTLLTKPLYLPNTMV